MKNSRKTNEGLVESSKFQTPSPKLQDRGPAVCGLALGCWSFSGAWSLRFGTFATLMLTPAITRAAAAEGSHSSEPASDLVTLLFVFMLATFVGLNVIRRVSRLLHTPLMSLTNAISAIAVVGAILVAGPEHPTFIHVLGLIAVVASVTNIVSGFLITDRMLKMFKKKPDSKPQ